MRSSSTFLVDSTSVINVPLCGEHRHGWTPRLTRSVRVAETFMGDELNYDRFGQRATDRKIVAVREL